MPAGCAPRRSVRLEGLGGKRKGVLARAAPLASAALYAFLWAASSPLAALENPGFEADLAAGGLPPGWEISGEGYELDIDRGGAKEGRAALVVRIDSPRGYARVVQHLVPAVTRADRLRVTAWLRQSPGPRRARAALRLRIDADDGLLYVDSTAALPSPWRRYSVEAPTFAEAASIEVGATFQGPGTYGLDGFEIAAVDTATLAEPSSTAKRYLEAALDVMRTSSIRRGDVDWPALEAAALRQLRGARSTADAHLAVRYAIALLGDRHSYLLSPSRSAELETEPVSNARTGRAMVDPRGEQIEPGIGYLFVPGFAGGRPEDQAAFAQSLQDAIRALDASASDDRASSSDDGATLSEEGTSPSDDGATCGWIVDLRRNSGGNLWPMLLGVGPLIGDGPAGAAVYPDGRRVPFWYRDGRVGLGDYVQLRVTRPYRSSRADPYVAVLLGERTASSGEILAGAFRGSPRHRSFGAATSGLATGNKSFALADGATLVLTVSATSDRTGAVVLGALEPDQAVAEAAALEAASAWLGAKCAFAAQGADDVPPSQPVQPPAPRFR